MARRNDTINLIDAAIIFFLPLCSGRFHYTRGRTNEFKSESIRDVYLVGDTTMFLDNRTKLLQEKDKRTIKKQS